MDNTWLLPTSKEWSLPSPSLACSAMLALRCQAVRLVRWRVASTCDCDITEQGCRVGAKLGQEDRGERARGHGFMLAAEEVGLTGFICGSNGDSGSCSTPRFLLQRSN